MESEITFRVEESPGGGYEAHAVGHSIFTDANTLDELKTEVTDAVRTHFEQHERPSAIRLELTFPLREGLRRDEALAILAAHRDEIHSRGVKSLALFGSVARDEAGPASDVDLLIEIDQQPFDLFELADLQLFLSDILQRPVDLAFRDSIRRELRDTVLNEAIDAA